MSNEYRRQLAAALSGDELTLRIVRDPAAEAVAFDPHAPLVDRVLAAAASGVMHPPVVESMIRDDPALHRAVVDLATSQTGDVTIGQAAGRDIVTIHVTINNR